MTEPTPSPLIALIEDEEHLAQGLLFNLAAEGYRTHHESDGDAALAYLLAPPEKIAAIVLDCMLPGTDGFIIARALRDAQCFTPILMLTARTRPEDILEGLEAGADDYLPKPFDLSILLVRIKSLLRRTMWQSTQSSLSSRSAAEGSDSSLSSRSDSSLSSRSDSSLSSRSDSSLSSRSDSSLSSRSDSSLSSRSDSSLSSRSDSSLSSRSAAEGSASVLPESPPDTYSFNHRTIRFDALELIAPHRTTHLTVMEADLLRYLTDRAGQIVSRKALLEEVWHIREDTDTRAIDNFIVRLRRYIEDDPANPSHLTTVRGIGYRFLPNP
jgi:DNA-binding response OmpR family regulator